MAEVETAHESFPLSQGDISPTSGSNSDSDSQADPRKLFVGGIPYDAVAQDLLNYFERYGPIREAVVIRDKNNPLQNQGYGFVIFEDPRIAQWVLSTEKNPIIKGRKANVQKGHKRAGLPSMSNGFHLPTTDSASILPSLYYTEPLSVMDAREAAAASGLLSLNQVTWPMANANERLLAAAGAFGNGYQYAGAPALTSVQDQSSLQWTQSLLMQQQQAQQQQQSPVYLPQTSVLLPTQLPSQYAAAAAAGISPSSSWPTSVLHPNGFSLLPPTSPYLPSATSANALSALAAAVANQQHGLMTPSALYTAASQTANGNSPSETAQAPLMTYLPASPSHTPPAAACMTSLQHVIEQSNGVA